MFFHGKGLGLVGSHGRSYTQPPPPPPPRPLPSSCPCAAVAVRAHLPAARLIAILRQPVKRAVSRYQEQSNAWKKNVNSKASQYIMHKRLEIDKPLSWDEVRRSAAVLRGWKRPPGGRAAGERPRGARGADGY